MSWTGLLHHCFWIKVKIYLKKFKRSFGEICLCLDLTWKLFRNFCKQTLNLLYPADISTIQHFEKMEVQGYPRNFNKQIKTQEKICSYIQLQEIGLNLILMQTEWVNIVKVKGLLDRNELIPFYSVHTFWIFTKKIRKLHTYLNLFRYKSSKIKSNVVENRMYFSFLWNTNSNKCNF